MNWVYADTSALVKRYVDEPGRRAVLNLLRRHPCVTSAVAPVELRGALRRRIGDGSIDAQWLPKLLQRIMDDRQYWTLVEVRQAVLSAAESLVATHAVRTLDAIHVTSARVFSDRLPGAAVLFVSADRRQIDAAQSIGLPTRFIGPT